jgi:hypothetical protein
MYMSSLLDIESAGTEESRRAYLAFEHEDYELTRTQDEFTPKLRYVSVLAEDCVDGGLECALYD